VGECALLNLPSNFSLLVSVAISVVMVSVAMVSVATEEQVTELGTSGTYHM